ncbi:restriction endonuclease subunit S [uncultured Fibrobacter sp.]|uniref:restriction endonuclease subunit S n=1 Tax=uncultured Fibrobacter sp. TaxID=261512 RepID=UPI0025965D86|nr:restriction endonuclease subunit S [uncultured Fibrobacter sp.]
MMNRLGDYIRPVDVRNRDLKVERLLGISVTKEFIPSIANTIGTDLSNYKVISENQFACSLMQVSRDGKMPIAMFKGEPCIMSPAYPMFEVSKKNELLPEYLMMWFSRSEFDREASFYAVGGVRGSLEWNDFCDMQIPVPAIEKQRETVAEYNTLATRIETNKKLIATLEQTAQTLYRHTFIDNIDPNNLPEGWRMGTLGEFGEVVTGKTPSSECPEDFGNDIPFVTPGDFQIYKKLAIGAERGLSIGGTQKLKTKVIPKKSILVTCIGSDMGKTSITTEDCITNQQINAIKPKDNFTCQYLYYMLRDMEAILKSIALGGSTMPMLSKSSFEVIPVLIPSAETMQQFYQSINAADDMILNKFKENQTLTQMQTLLLSKMGA